MIRFTATGNSTERADTAHQMSSITPTVHLAPPAGHIYTTETVRLQCHAEGRCPEWTYQLLHDGQSSPSVTDPNHSIDSASLADAGQYWCQIQQGAHQVALFH